jgi:flagellar hook protein FlgE
VVVSISTISKITTETVMEAPAFSDILLTLDQANGTRPAIREYVTHGTVTRSGLGELEFDHNNIYINDGDGKYLVGRLVPVVFTNNNGLDPMGDNVYRKTVNSGDPMVTKNTIEVKNGMLEMSNSDLAESLVNLMVFQRAYEANSKALSTSDEFLKTAINLKK